MSQCYYDYYQANDGLWYVLYDGWSSNGAIPSWCMWMIPGQGEGKSERERQLELMGMMVFADMVDEYNEENEQCG